MRLLLDEMYPDELARMLREHGIDADSVTGLGLGGMPDADVLAFAAANDYALLTENVADFVRLSAEFLTAGRKHDGVLLALSSRFSRRPAGYRQIVAAVLAQRDAALASLVVYLEAPR